MAHFSLEQKVGRLMQHKMLYIQYNLKCSCMRIKGKNLVSQSFLSELVEVFAQLHYMVGQTVIKYI